MKYRIEKIPEGENEVILRYCRMTPEVERVWNFLHNGQARLMGWKDKTHVVLDIDKILYFESVLFFLYVVFLYICVFLVYKAKRRIDDKIMNDNLRAFQTRRTEHAKCD